MPTAVTREGGFLKVVVDTNRPKYFCLGSIELPKVQGDLVSFEDGNSIDWNDLTAPIVTSAEQFADVIGGYIQDYNTGQ